MWRVLLVREVSSLVCYSLYCIVLIVIVMMRRRHVVGWLVGYLCLYCIAVIGNYRRHC